MYGIKDFGVSIRQEIVQKKEIKCRARRNQHNYSVTTYY